MRRQVVRGIDRRRVGVVLVDASADLRWLTRMALERDGRFQVVGEAGSGRAGVGLAAACEADLVLLDLTLPGTDGLATMARLQEAAPQAEVIVFTCALRSAEVEAALGLGALGVVRKGAPLGDVVAQVAGLYADRQAPAPLTEPARLRPVAVVR